MIVSGFGTRMPEPTESELCRPTIFRSDGRVARPEANTASAGFDGKRSRPRTQRSPTKTTLTSRAQVRFWACLPDIVRRRP